MGTERPETVTVGDPSDALGSSPARTTVDRAVGVGAIWQHGAMSADSTRGTAARPLVGIVMGSDSDWPVMRAAADALADFDVAVEVDVVSAHRQPDKTLDYGRAAAARGLRVIIAGAGGAAGLPGMLAAVTPLPVIGVPVPLAYFDGLDSLLSMVQMPAGVPVATVSVGGARNAGLLAVRMLAAGSDDGAASLRAAMLAFQVRLRDEADVKGARLRAQYVAGRRGQSTGFSA